MEKECEPCGEKVSFHTNLSASANRSRKKPFPLSCMPQSRLLPEGLLEFQSCSPSSFPPYSCASGKCWLIFIFIKTMNLPWGKGRMIWKNWGSVAQEPDTTCMSCAVMACWQILDLGWMEGTKASNSPLSPQHHSYSTANYKPDVAKTRGSDLPDWSRSPSHVWF